MCTPGAGPQDRGYGYHRICYVPRGHAGKPRSALPTSEGRRPKRAVMLALTGRRAPGAPATQEDDPGRCEAQLDPLGALPALLPARVVADLRVEPHAWALRLEHALVGGEV